MNKRFLIPVLAAMIPFGANAQDFENSSNPWSGWTVLSGGVLMHGPQVLGTELRLTHYFDQSYYHFHPVIDFSVTDQGGTWLGAGVYIEGEYKTSKGNLFVGASFAPGLYIRGSEIDLGYPLEFRSGIEAGIKTNNGYRISLSYDHRSNGRIRRQNPGMETIQLRIGKHFN